jgi:Ca-activated chloride channel family protein
VGSGVNRSLTAPAARAGRGVELVIGLGEDVEPFVKRLLARTSAPLLADVQVSGSALSHSALARLPDLYGGAPALLPLRLRPEGGSLIITARSADGLIEEHLEVKPVDRGEGSPALAALYARECVEELELALATGAAKHEVDPQIERLGLDFQISTRLTSWVAVSAQPWLTDCRPRASGCARRAAR